MRIEVKHDPPLGHFDSELIISPPRSEKRLDLRAVRDRVKIVGHHCDLDV